MCRIGAIGLTLIFHWVQVSRSTRIQPKEALNRVEIQNNGLESADTSNDAQKSYVLLRDSPKKALSKKLHSKKEATVDQSKKLKATAMLLAAKMKDGKLKDGHPFNSSSSFISRVQQSSKSGATQERAALHQDDAKAKASESVAAAAESTAKTESQASTDLWAKLPIFVQAVLAGHLPVQIIGEYVWYCSVGIFAMFFCACSCCCVDWMKNITRHYMAHKSEMKEKLPAVNDALVNVKRKSSGGTDRNQYKHKDRVIYEWQQTTSSMMVFTKLPPGLTKRNIEVKIWPRHMKIGRVGKVPFLKEEMFSLVDVEESTWDILANGELMISLRKSQSMEWPCVFRAHHPDKLEVQ